MVGQQIKRFVSIMFLCIPQTFVQVYV